MTNRYGGCSGENNQAMKILRGGKTDEVEPQLPAVKESAKKPTKRKEIDTGKLMALRKAGWSMKDIGIELGCSEGTIFNYLKKMEKKTDV